MSYKNLLVEFKNKIALVTLNRPDKLNALNGETLTDHPQCFLIIKTNESNYCYIITGSGEKAFVAGADISEINKLNMLEGKKFAEFGQAVFSLIENFDKPVIAAVNGFALGGG